MKTYTIAAMIDDKPMIVTQYGLMTKEGARRKRVSLMRYNPLFKGYKFVVVNAESYYA